MAPLPSRYYFGIYHWRRRAASIAAALVAAALSLLLGRRADDSPLRLVAAGAAVGALADAVRVTHRTLSPPPWALERAKYDALARRLPLGRADRLLDVGCGTGRSLAGLAPHVSPETDAIGLDVFDDRVILGNAPALARRNGARAGLEAAPVVGDATTLPFADDSIDVVTASRLLHDLEAPAADRALCELRRVCEPDGGAVGILELPLLPGGVSDDRDPERYWRERVAAAGLRVDALERVARDDIGEPYIVIVASPTDSPGA